MKRTDAYRCATLLLLLAPALAGCRRARNPAANRRGAAANAPGDSGVPSGPRVVTRTGPPLVLEYTTDEHAIRGGPDTIVNGVVEIRLHNEGAVPHEVRFLRLLPNRQMDEVRAYITAHDTLPPGAWFQPGGGAGPLPPGGRMSVVQNLLEGRYIIICSLPDADGRPWYAKGLVRTLVVTGRSPKAVQPPLLLNSAIVTTSDFAPWRITFTVRTSRDRAVSFEGRGHRTQLPRGENIIALDHNGGPGHDAVIIMGTEQGDMRRYMAWLDGDRRVIPRIVGGIPALIPSRSYMTLTLGRGAYFVFCPTLKRGGEGRYGFELGEFDQFVVK